MQNRNELPWFIRSPNPEIFLKGRGLCLDLETTILDRGSPLNHKNRILLACWHFTDSEEIKARWGGENDLKELLKDIEEADFLIAHNAKFELGWLKRCGLDLRKVLVYDTMLAEWVLLGNRKHLGIDLARSAERRGVKGKVDVVAKMIHNLGVDTENIPRKWLQTYCQQDVRATTQLYLAQLKLLESTNRLHLCYQRGLVCACLADIEFNGLCLDKDRVHEEYNKVFQEWVEAKKELESNAPINWRSGKQVGEYLYDTLGFQVPTDSRGNTKRTTGGARPTDKETVSALVPRSKEQARILELYKIQANLNAKLTKNLEFFKGVVDDHEGVFLGSFNQGHTVTHRLSSSGRPIEINGKNKSAQLQNIPREYKRLFKPKREGWVYLDSDGSQLEFRVAADLGNDPVAKEEIETEKDIHSITAETLTKAGEKTTRQDAKSRTFRPLYGGSSGTKAEQAYCKFFRKKYSELFHVQTEWTYEVLKTGELVTAYGMRFYWPGTKSSRSGFIDNTTSIFNFPVQGFATAEIIPLALVVFWHKTELLRLEVVNTVHDSIAAEVHPKDVEEAKQIAVQCFTTDVYKLLKEIYNYEFQTSLGCEVKIGEHWGEGKGEKVNVKPQASN